MPASAGGSSKVRPACRSGQDTAFDERRQDRGARASVQSPQPLGLGDGEAQSRHFAVLALDSQKQVPRLPVSYTTHSRGLCRLRLPWWLVLSGVIQGLARRSKAIAEEP